jgi:hypothetical protein
MLLVTLILESVKTFLIRINFLTCLGKELQCGMLFVKTPGVLLKASGTFNLTLPSQPVIKLNAKIQEQSKNNYRV